MSSDEITASHPTLALAAVAGSLLAGRRVAVIGDCSTGLADRVAEISQRRVHAYDPVATRAAAAIAAGARNVIHAPLDEALAAHEGAFDAVLLTDRGDRDLSELIELAAGLLSPRGFLLLASPNPEASDEEAPGYYELYDAVAAHFEHVRMLGQAPFVGYTVAEFALDGEPAVTIDTSLVPRSEEPSHYLALASARPIDALEPYTLVQLPLEGIGPQLVGAPAGDTAAIAEAQVRIAALQSELDRLKEREREIRQSAKERQAATSVMSARLAELEAERDALARRRDEERAAHERELSRQRQRTEEAARQAREAEERARRAERGVEDRGRDQRRHDAELAEARKRAEAAEQRLEAAEARAKTAEARAKTAEARAKAAEARAETAEARAGATEKKLRDAGEASSLRKRIAHLEGALDRARADHAARLEAVEETHQEELDAMLERIAELELAAEEAESAAAKRDAEPESETVEAETPSPATVRGFTFQIEELRKALAQARSERDEARDRAILAEADLESARRAALEAAESAAAKSAAAQSAASDGDEELAAELERLEAHLKERGQRVAALEAELREAERIGRELLRRLRAEPPAATPAPDVTALVQRCSRCEADLQAARWRLASLEEQASARAEAPVDEAATLLEDALRRSQAEVAELRRALAARGG